MKPGRERQAFACPKESKSWRGPVCAFGLFVGLAEVIGISAPGAVLASEGGPSIRVRVNNYSYASRTTMAQAEREAERILRKTGLRTVWMDCPANREAWVPDAACETSLEANEIVLRVVAEPNQNMFEDTVFGFAVAPILATVYYEPARRRARSDNSVSEGPIILGCAIAHELGHLLLGRESHTVAGIMLPRWERRQIQEAMQGCLSFTPKQAKDLRAAALARMERATAPHIFDSNRRERDPDVEGARYRTSCCGETESSTVFRHIPDRIVRHEQQCRPRSCARAEQDAEFDRWTAPMGD